MVTLLPAAGALLALLCLWGALRANRRRRMLANLPTCKTTGVFIGLVELKGTAECDAPLTSYLAEIPCVHYSYSIDEHWSRTVTETYTDSQGKTRTRTRHESGWTTVDSGGRRRDFELQDDYGRVRVLPDGAQLEPRSVFSHTCGRWDPLYYGKGPAGAVSDSDHRRRFTEAAIPVHAPVYVVGQARERQDIVAPEIAKSATAPLFLISTRSEQQVSAGYFWQYWSLAVFGLMLAVGGFVFATHVDDRPLEKDLPLYLLAGGGFLLVWLLGWFLVVYNSLVDLRQRVRQAWSNVDVQLKRRHDLIPQLVRVVEGLRDHEREVQTQLAALRAQLAATPPGQAGPDPRGCTPLLLAIVERYPELRAHESFLALQRSLADTETRLALARNYFNEVATFHNTRLATVPDGWVAQVACLAPQPLLGDTFAAPRLDLAPALS